MSASFREQYEADNPELARRIRHDIPEPGYMHNFAFLKMGDKGIKYVHEVMKYPEEIISLTVAGNKLTDASAPLIADIIRKAPKMVDLTIARNNFTAAGFAEIAKAVAEHPIIEQFRCFQNGLSGSGEAISDLFRNTKNLKHFSANEAGISDADFIKFAPELAKNGTLNSVVFSDNKPGAAGAAAFADAALIQNRNLNQAPMATQDEDARAPYLRTFMDSRASLLLLDVNPYDERVTPKAKLNRSEMEDARRKLAKINELTGPDLRRIEARYANIFAEKYVDKAGYEALVENLPALPRHDEKLADGLFHEDAQGFAPLDNPRLWKDAASAKGTLDALLLTREVLSKTTQKGSGLLDAAAAVIPGEELVGYLNAKGIKLGVDVLLTEEGKPTPLLAQMTHTHQAGALLALSNWVGQPTEGLREVFDAIPDYQHQHSGYHQLVQQMKSSRSAGIGR